MIPTFDPLIKSQEINKAIKSLKEKYLGEGKYTIEFEKISAKILNVDKKKVVSVNTGFSAIHLCCLLLNIKKGDEVIMPSLTNVADAQSVLALGGKIVFCDIDPKTFCIDTKQILKLITNKTKLIIPIDYGSSLADHNQIKYISKKYGIKVLHDAAHSFGSKYLSKKIGNIHDLTIFSFDPVKTFTCIDGGLIICKNYQQSKILRHMKLMGIVKNENTTSDVKSLGFRYHLANLHAAIGVEQLKKIETIKKNRIKYFNFYRKNIFENKNIILPSINSSDDVIPFHYVIRIKNNRKRFMNFMRQKGIQTGIHWKPLHEFSYFKKNNCSFINLKNTEIIGRQIVTLPFHSFMSTKILKKIVFSINEYFKKSK